MNNKTLVIAGAVLVALAAVAVAPTASAYGVCVGACADVWQDDNGQVHQQNCVGNVNVQVGLNNEAHYCND